MSSYSSSEIELIAAETGFNPRVIEKAVHLLNLLNMLNSHPVIKGNLALKGGTALNLFIFEAPRLSVDIDLNFMFRQPLWDVVRMGSHCLGNFQAKDIPVLSACELFAGRLVALFARSQARDLFDTYKLLNRDSKIDRNNLRTAFVVYGAMSRKDWRTVSIEDISVDANELRQKLLPVLNPRAIYKFEDFSRFGQMLAAECRNILSIVCPLSKNEFNFLDLMLEKGIVEPALLTSDKELQKRIERHPMLLWKALNVRQHFNITAG